MHFGRSTGPLAHSLLAVLALSAGPTIASAQSHDNHAADALSQPHRPTREESALAGAVRDATVRFKNVTSVDGPGEDYKLMFGCVSGGDFGAMGLHYVNFPLVLDGEIDVNQPEIVLFEPTRDGRIRITGADFLVLAEDWEAKHPGQGPPQLSGQLFHLFDSPNRFGLKARCDSLFEARRVNARAQFVRLDVGGEGASAGSRLAAE